MTIWQKLGAGFAVPARAASRRLPTTGFAADAAHPTVVELFQSQGCSSCPPGRRQSRGDQRSRRRARARLRGRLLGPARLEGHVLQAAWTARQYAYAHAMGRDGVYTPQVVVNGRVEGDGLEAGELRGLIQRGDRGAGGPRSPSRRRGRGRARARRRGRRRRLARPLQSANGRGRDPARRERRPHAAVQGRGARDGPPRPLAWRGGDLPAAGRGRTGPRRGGDRAGRRGGADPGGRAEIARRKQFCRSVNFPLRHRDVLQMFRPTISPGRGADMVARVSTVAFEGVEARPVDVQVQIASGTVVFNIVGLGDKAVARIARAGALGADRLRPRAAGQAHHRQSRARRPAEGGQPLRPADRARRDGGDRRHPASTRSRAMRSSANWRSTERSARSPACCRRRSPPTRRGRASSVRRPAGPRRPGPRPISTFSRPAR